MPVVVLDSDSVTGDGRQRMNVRSIGLCGGSNARNEVARGSKDRSETWLSHDRMCCGCSSLRQKTLVENLVQSAVTLSLRGL